MNAAIIANLTTAEGDRPDRPVPATAHSCPLRYLRNSRITRSSQRLQRLVWSDPNMHRAEETVHKECEWKRGERVDFRFRFQSAMTCNNCFWMKFFTGASGRQRRAVNGGKTMLSFSIDAEGPSHGRIRVTFFHTERCQIFPSRANCADSVSMSVLMGEFSAIRSMIVMRFVPAFVKN